MIIKMLFASPFRVILWILYIILLIVGFSYPYMLAGFFIYFLIGPCVAIPGLLACSGKKVKSTKNLSQLKDVVSAVHASGGGKWQPTKGDGQINYKLMTKNPERAPTVSVNFENIGNGTILVYVRMTECSMGSLFGLLGLNFTLFLNLLPPIAFWVSGGNRALAKVNQIINAIRRQEPRTEGNG